MDDDPEDALAVRDRPSLLFLVSLEPFILRNLSFIKAVEFVSHLPQHILYYHFSLQPPLVVEFWFLISIMQWSLWSPANDLGHFND